MWPVFLYVYLLQPQMSFGTSLEIPTQYHDPWFYLQSALKGIGTGTVVIPREKVRTLFSCPNILTTDIFFYLFNLTVCNK